MAGGLLRLDLVARNVADNAMGTVWVALSQARPSEEISGSGVAFTVTLRGVASGAQGALRVTQATLATRDGRVIPAAVRGAEVRVVGAASAPATPPPPPRPALELTAAALATPESSSAEPGGTSGPGAAPAPRSLLAEPVALVAAALLGAALVAGVDAWQRRGRGPR